MLKLCHLLKPNPGKTALIATQSIQDHTNYLPGRKGSAPVGHGHFYIAISFTLFIICTPCTNVAPPRIAAATCTASIICASL